VVLVERFDPSSALEAIQKYGVTVLAGAAHHVVHVGRQCPTWPRRFATVGIAMSGAAALDPSGGHGDRGEVRARGGEGYGLTEASPVVTTSFGLPWPPGSVGSALDGVEMRLVDVDGEDALVGDPGEIWVRGPNVFHGYWNDEEATRAALDAEGWLHTGDVAVVDDDGLIYLVDRAKDLIIVSGFNVFPAEVEDVIAEMPGVAECAVVGVPHPHTGESVKAFVARPRVRPVEEDAVIEHCADQPGPATSARRRSTSSTPCPRTCGQGPPAALR
jgi:long-chain acyl-CoA synthetase